MDELKNNTSERLSEILRFLRQLSQGIDPTCGIEFTSDTVLMNSRIRSVLKDAHILLDEYLTSKESLPDKAPLARFTITADDAMNFEYSIIPISISSFVYKINGALKKSNMKNLKATHITEWLVSQGYLKTCASANGENYKVPTDTGELLGIEREEKTNSRGTKYYVNLYNQQAQRFLLERIANELTK